KIRVRFDAGYHIDNPDRAEFFYAKCGCYRQLQGLPIFDPKAPGPGPGIVTDLTFQQVYVDGETAFMDRLALFGDARLRSIQPKGFAAAGPPGTFGDQSGFGDVRAGARLALMSTPAGTLTAQVQGDFPSGDAKKGLGTHHTSIEPALLAYGKVNDRLAIEGQ